MQSEHSETSPAPLLDLTVIPADILLLGKRLADTKYQIDVLGKQGWGELTGNLHGLEASGEWNGPDDALTFFSKIFPFASLPSENSPPGIWQVPVERVIGRSWRWWPEHLTANSEEKLREHLAGDQAADGTLYYFISSLAMLLAVQGQSRVNYCRQRHIPFITARVIGLTYPPASRFTIYHVTKGATRQSWVVINDRYLQAVHWPRITLPVLTRYGVHSALWPQKFPATDLIFEELHSPQPAQDFIAPCVDLHALQQKIDAAKLAAKPTKMAIGDMGIVNIWPVSITLTGLFLLSLIITGVTAGEGWPGLLSLLGCAVSASMLLFMVAPVFQVRQNSGDLSTMRAQESLTESTKHPQPPAETA
ncbi:hypothetical protein [Erwinia pyrifoliae]|uniref:Uncharacterized protein n=1 Tax=Erwinia pyrifoliae TaxID=79967 RepID=A0ABY5X4X6_ERWPY|nr:hypothetical protein [Erwinia pyrifoliae]AUX72051.1 hypothetical protein CPI84_05900 [Erwinia pyrifoliae]MCA8877708.1 hypothetical protein [Erwinia pyrifoliae]MCT2388299.1 hypothetical protein [Erwinia pyrifoliae]MCU8586469.1 hypothetical protein [Erwinia pyrifoliae]UWS30360.1 hypothetical protein NYP81_02350 [Erwinia pyrifoliae]